MHARTALICSAAPVSFVELADAKAQLRITSTTDEVLIQSIIDAACAFLDGGDGALKRAIGAQTWQLVLPGLVHHHWGHLRLAHRRRIDIPLPPTKTITSITYFDTNNAVQTLDPAQYSLINCGTEPSYIAPAAGVTWPSTFCRDDAVTVTLTAGYADVPAPIYNAALLMVRQLYAMGERNIFTTGDTVFGVGAKQFAVSAAAAQVMQNAIDSLLFNYRILRTP